MRFRATILSSGKTAAGIQVPNAIVEALGTSRKPAVRVTINGYTYRSSIASMGGVFMLGVSKDVRAKADVVAGQAVDIDIELDTERRVVTIPPDLAAALDADPVAKPFFERLSYSNKRRIVEPIDDAKTPATRQRRIDTSVERLRNGRI